jgi:hypothetical protein
MAVVQLSSPQEQIPIARYTVYKIGIALNHSAAGPNKPLLMFSYVKHGPNNEILGTGHERIVMTEEVRAVLEKEGSLETAYATVLAGALGIITK